MEWADVISTFVCSEDAAAELGIGIRQFVKLKRAGIVHSVGVFGRKTHAFLRSDIEALKQKRAARKVEASV
jgi:hypothetical protein